jgi:hypothetical protein
MNDTGKKVSQRARFTYHINQNIRRPFPSPDEFGSVILTPLLPLVFPKIPFEYLLAPRTIDWVGDWSKCRYGLVFARIFKELVSFESRSPQKKREKKNQACQ